MADGTLERPARGPTADLAIAALVTDQAYMALGNERFDRDGATFTRNRDAPDIWDANHVAHVTASTPDGFERLLAQADQEFAGSPHRRFHLDFRTPPALEPRLLLDGYEHSDSLILVLEGDPEGEPPAHEIRPVESDADWAAYGALHDLDWREDQQRTPQLGDFNEETARQTVLVRRRKSPPAQVWLACVEGEPRAYLTSWGGVDGMGMLEDLFCHPEYRHRGLATALIHNGVAAARADGAAAVLIPADPKDTPKNMYAAMGFQPTAHKRNYLKRLGERSH